MIIFFSTKNYLFINRASSFHIHARRQYHMFTCLFGIHNPLVTWYDYINCATKNVKYFIRRSSYFQNQTNHIFLPILSILVSHQITSCFWKTLIIALNFSQCLRQCVEFYSESWKSILEINQFSKLNLLQWKLVHKNTNTSYECYWNRRPWRQCSDIICPHELILSRHYDNLEKCLL